MMSPILISLYVGIYLKDVFSLPDLSIIFFILFGVFSGAYSVYKIITGKGNSKW